MQENICLTLKKYKQKKILTEVVNSLGVDDKYVANIDLFHLTLINAYCRYRKEKKKQKHKKIQVSHKIDSCIQKYEADVVPKSLTFMKNNRYIFIVLLVKYNQQIIDRNTRLSKKFYGNKILKFIPHITLAKIPKVDKISLPDLSRFNVKRLPKITMVGENLYSRLNKGLNLSR
ncbi:MAG: hypothetical protein JJV93_00200 [Alphaproteobacteria bacterium]|nr:hypothetical protein [Alphaproteobacteria bacterium]MBL0717677.1 hypothetical protein [Alphaproteobacteria bacterium]